jgi:hypothetical protein
MINIPIFKAVIEENNDGINAIAFVREPAVDAMLLKFNKNKKNIKLSVIDNTKRKIIFPIMRCDYPIYRYDKIYGEYYIIYTKEVIEKMARKMIADKVTDNFNVEHNSNDTVNGIYLEELFIKNTKKGINPVGYEDIEEYSLFGVYAIDNEEVWEQIENGTFTGLSLEGFFNLDYLDEDVEDMDELNEWEEILNLFKRVLKQNN